MVFTRKLKGCDLLKPESIIDVTPDELVRLQNIFNLMVDKVVEGVDMLLHKPLHLEKGG